MTLQKLQDLAQLLGNSTWCRWWAWWSYPSQEPWEIAISCLEIRDEGRGPQARAVPLPDLVAQGFREERRGKALYYVIARTNEFDGTDASAGPVARFDYQQLWLVPSLAQLRHPATQALAAGGAMLLKAHNRIDADAHIAHASDRVVLARVAEDVDGAHGLPPEGEPASRHPQGAGELQEGDRLGVAVGGLDHLEGGNTDAGHDRQVPERDVLVVAGLREADGKLSTVGVLRLVAELNGVGAVFRGAATAAGVCHVGEGSGHILHGQHDGV